jgi:hypothetical protein
LPLGLRSKEGLLSEGDGEGGGGMGRGGGVTVHIYTIIAFNREELTDIRNFVFLKKLFYFNVFFSVVTVGLLSAKN